MIGFLFSPHGRMGRRGYLAAIISVGAVVYGTFFFYLWQGRIPNLGPNSFGLAFGIPGLLALWIWSCATIKRLHDAGYRGFWLLLGLVGFGWLMSAIMLFWPGERGDNRFGPDPRSA